MGSLRVRSGKLMLDFYYQGVRCREQTLLKDTPINRAKLENVLSNIEKQIQLKCFVYRDTFPNSRRCEVFKAYDDAAALLKKSGITYSPKLVSNVPNFAVFAIEWFDENRIHWKASHYENILRILKNYLIPEFGRLNLDDISREHILKFRKSVLCPINNHSGREVTNDWVNHVMTPLRGILREGSVRFGYPNPYKDIKPLKVLRTKIEPFSLDEIHTFLNGVRDDFKPYYIVRFFTGLRTAEIDGLKWEYVHLDRAEIIIHETLVNGRVETPKTAASYRSVQLSKRVIDALKEQHARTGHLEYVFVNQAGNPLEHHNVRNRVWYPTLEKLGIKKRRPYQTRHTCATLWLSAGESPEWIAKQLGHSTTKMLFEVYSRFVPNNTRQDGTAFEAFLEAHARAQNDSQEVFERECSS